MDNSLENRYYRFLRDRAYSDTEFLRRVLSVYLPYFAGHSRVLDVGCGHGEFLRLLSDAGHTAVGVDVDPGMVEACCEQGLTAYHADVAEWLPAQGEAFDGVFSSNMIEHLTVPQVLTLVKACSEALRPGGVLLLAVPNPESIIVQLNEFWRDATHVRLYSRQLLEFFLHDAGYVQVESAENDVARWEPGTNIIAMQQESLAPFPNMAPLTPIPDNLADIHVPALPRPARRIKMADAYWETLRRELALLHQGVIESRQIHQAGMADMQRRISAIERRLALIESPYIASREVFVLGYKVSSREAN